MTTSQGFTLASLLRSFFVSMHRHRLAVSTTQGEGATWALSVGLLSASAPRASALEFDLVPPPLPACATHVHTKIHAHTHARTHARTHAYTAGCMHTLHRRTPSRTHTHTKKRDVSRVDERLRVGRASGRVLCEALRELKRPKHLKSQCPNTIT